jgi:UDP-4-amino-4-deoxy-L-arabinose formyltransferase/UDP-glucuronic acid dehydrogenase (UDP-4-keto-hexauronic acid decarboxylating)
LTVRPEGDVRVLASEGDKALADWLLCFNSMTIVPAAVLARVTKGAVNFHPGRLPEYAGLFTHQWAIRNGESEAGVTLHFMEAGVDTGDVIAEVMLPIAPEETGFALFNRCIKTASEMIVAVVGDIVAGKVLPRRAQDQSKRRLYRRADAQDGTIDWTWSATKIANFARAGDYHPFTSPSYSAVWMTPSGREVTVLTAVPEDGVPSVGAARLDGDSPLVGCGDGQSVRITRALYDGAVIAPEDWARFLEN